MDGGLQGPGGASAATNSSDFVKKLYKMLEDPAYEQIVRWGDGGDSFVVLENEKFTKLILPKHFKHSNFASFVRQLNKYDFHKVRHNNEENGQSPYGPGAWEFKHPEFQINNKDSLDNIRRKAPASRKAAQVSEETVQIQQMDLVNAQLVATQQQLQALQDRYEALRNSHSMMIQELIAVQKSVVNHEHVLADVMRFLGSVDDQIRVQRRNSRINGVAMFDQSHDPSALDMSTQQISPSDDHPASPLQNAQKYLNDGSALAEDHLEQMNELYRQISHSMATPPSEHTIRNGAVSSAQGVPSRSTTISNSVGYSSKFNGDYQDNVYPAGQTNGIDPAYAEHYPNIPYPMPTASELEASEVRRQYGGDGRKKSVVIDPGWIRAPQILLVEDDPTCRRIGGKFLYSFKCAIDTAFDGLEAVEKINNGSKYDLILMDIIMPNLDGVSACRAIRHYDTTPIIAMTSNIRNDDISMYFAHGMNDVLPKPFTKEGLLTLLEKHLGHLKEPKAQTKSPTSNWHSPNQITGVSPTGTALTDDAYGNTIRASQQHGTDGYSHRRTVSEMSGAEEITNDGNKRQRLFGPLHPNAMAGQMQRSGPGG